METTEGCSVGGVFSHAVNVIRSHLSSSTDCLISYIAGDEDKGQVCTKIRSMSILQPSKLMRA